MAASYPVQMHNPKVAAGHQDMVVSSDDVERFEAEGWEVVKPAAPAEEPAASDEAAQSDARRKPRKVAEQS